MTIDRVAVVIPAADEQEHIAGCLHAIAEASCQLLRSDLGVAQVHVIVVLDGCLDRTPAIVADFVAEGSVRAVTSTCRRVGGARYVGARNALASLGRADSLWLANTDADSTVPSDWLTTMVVGANDGAHVVLGTVVPDHVLQPTVRAAWLSRHDLREGHAHIHGANLGIRADTYLALGGWRRDLASHEDVDLAHRASTSPGINILRTARIPVVTSARLDGRAPDGFARYLRDLSDTVALTDRRSTVSVAG